MTTKPRTWVRKASRELATCRVFQVREVTAESGDQRAQFYVIDNADWVNVIATTPDGDFVLIEQFRHGVESVTLEIPGGTIDDGEDPAVAAARELTEETGFTGGEMIYLGRSHPNPALQSNWVYHYLAKGAVQTTTPSFDEHESVVTHLVSAAELRRILREGKLTHSLAVAAFQYYSMWKEEQLNEG